MATNRSVSVIEDLNLRKEKLEKIIQEKIIRLELVLNNAFYKKQLVINKISALKNHSKNITEKMDHSTFIELMQKIQSDASVTVKTQYFDFLSNDNKFISALKILTKETIQYLNAQFPLPADVLSNIAAYLPPRYKGNFALTCRLFNNASALRIHDRFLEVAVSYEEIDRAKTADILNNHPELIFKQGKITTNYNVQFYTSVIKYALNTNDSVLLEIIDTPLKDNVSSNSAHEYIPDDWLSYLINSLKIYQDYSAILERAERSIIPDENHRNVSNETIDKIINDLNLIDQNNDSQKLRGLYCRLIRNFVTLSTEERSLLKDEIISLEKSAILTQRYYDVFPLLFANIEYEKNNNHLFFIEVIGFLQARIPASFIKLMTTKFDIEYGSVSRGPYTYFCPKGVIHETNNELKPFTNEIHKQLGVNSALAIGVITHRIEQKFDIDYDYHSYRFHLFSNNEDLLTSQKSKIKDINKDYSLTFLTNLTLHTFASRSTDEMIKIIKKQIEPITELVYLKNRKRIK